MKKNKRIPPILWLMTLSVFFSPVLAQQASKASIVGLVIEAESEEPLEFVNVTLFKVADTLMVNGATTDKNGKFELTQVPIGEYFLQLSFIGFETTNTKPFSIKSIDQKLDMEELDIEMSTTLLEDVEVVAEQATYNASVSRKIYNVKKDVMSQSSSVTEMLQNLPSISVGPSGQISLRGTTNVTFFINGSPSALMRANPTAALQAIPANTIERIEVITNPSAKYRPDGAGGIINIVLKEEALEGWNGTFMGSVGNYQRYNGNITLNYGKEDVNISGSYGFRNASTPRDIFDERRERDGAGGPESRYESISRATFDEQSHLANLAAEFPLGDGTLEIDGEFFYLKSDNNAITDWQVQEEDLSKFTIDRIFDGFEKEYDVSAAYELEIDGEDHLLALELAHGAYDEKEDNFFDTRYTRPSSALDRTHNLIEKGGPLTEFKIDYMRPLGEKSKLELGYLASLVRDDISNLAENFDPDQRSWIINPARTNLFKFNQDIHAFYGTFGQSFESFSYLAGLRAENTTIKSNLVTTNTVIPNDYFNLFPSLSLTWELDRNKQLQLNYSKRVNRADSDELNPFPEYQDPRTRDAGNPLIKPEQIHSVELGYQLYKKNYSFISSLYYRYKFDAFTEISEIQDDSVLHTTFANLSNEQLYGLELIWKGDIKETVDLTFSANGYYNDLDASNLGFTPKSRFSWDSKLAAGINITGTTYGQINANYLSSRVTPQGEFQPLFLLNFGLRQSLWQGKANLTFTISDVFASLEWESVVDTPDLYRKITFGRNQQIFHVGFSYNFGQLIKKRDRLQFEDAIEELPNASTTKEEEIEEEE